LNYSFTQDIELARPAHTYWILHTDIIAEAGSAEEQAFHLTRTAEMQGKDKQTKHRENHTTVNDSESMTKKQKLDKNRNKAPEWQTEQPHNGTDAGHLSGKTTPGDTDTRPPTAIGYRTASTNQDHEGRKRAKQAAGGAPPPAHLQKTADRATRATNSDKRTIGHTDQEEEEDLTMTNVTISDNGPASGNNSVAVVKYTSTDQQLKDGRKQLDKILSEQAKIKKRLATVETKQDAQEKTLAGANATINLLAETISSGYRKLDAKQIQANTVIEEIYNRLQLIRNGDDGDDTDNIGRIAQQISQRNLIVAQPASEMTNSTTISTTSTSVVAGTPLTTPSSSGTGATAATGGSKGGQN
jgi:hypothetical protein